MELVFYRSKERPNYYLIYKDRTSVNAERMLRILNNTGEYINSGFPKVDVELAYRLEIGLMHDFLNFLIEKVATNHIEHPKYNGQSFQAWHEFKNYEPEKWLNDFQQYQNLKFEETMKHFKGTQVSLF